MSKRTPPVVLVLTLLLPLRGIAQSSVQVETFSSAGVGGSRNVAFLLPEGYEPTRRYPVLYLLHGYSGDHLDWSTRTGLKAYVQGWPLIVVMPEVGNSWYVNARADSSARYEDFMVSDLPRLVAGRYGIDTLRQAIAGLSMGGYGAVMLALKHPSRYQFAGSLSGALGVPGEIPLMETASWARSIRPSVLRAFGEERSERWDEVDLFRLFRNAGLPQSPFLYLVTGAQDGFPTFLPAHRAFTDSLRSAGAVYEYHEVPGGHNWQFWDHQLPFLLQRLREVMNF